MKTRARSSLIFGIGLLAGLAAAVGVYLAGGRLGAARGPVFLPGGEAVVGQRGPVGVQFPQPVDAASIEMYLRIEPPAGGAWRWQGQTVWFEPQPAFTENQVYQLRILPGAKEAQGRAVPASEWQFRVRPAWLAYLSPASGGREIWRAAGDGSLPQQLTRTEGRVEDYSVTRDGERVVFSAGNGGGGSDIWQVERDGERQTRLVDCGRAVCAGAAVSADGSRIAYSHSEQTGVDGAPFIYDAETRQSRPLYNDILIRAAYFSWSADGQKLAFYDSGMGAVRVYDFSTGRDTLFESNLPGPVSWSPDGQRLIFLHEDNSSGFARVVIFLADLGRQKVEPVFGDVAGDDTGLPVWSPDGEELLFSQRILRGSSSRQLNLIRPDGSGLKAVTDDLRYTTAAYQWSPNGKQVVFQRYAFGSSDNRPEVVVWEREKGEFRVLAMNAAQPQWLP